MNTPPRRVGQRNSDPLLMMLMQQLSQGSKSAESTRQVLLDRSGQKHSLGGRISKVVVDDVDVPVVLNEFQAQVLDCGHAVTSAASVLGMCEYGHILCLRHALHRCCRCGKLICEIEMQEKDGALICPDCAGNPALIIAVCLFGVAMLLLLLMV